MKKSIIVLLVGLGLATSGVASSVMAKTPRPTPLYPTTVEMHFVGPNGKTRTVTERVNIDAGHDCSGALYTLTGHPEIAGMTMTDVKCTDSAGASRPGGPAIVIVHYVDPDRVLHQMVVDHRGSSTYDMKTCPFVLHLDQATFRTMLQSKSPGSKIVSAECVPRTKYSSTLGNNVN